MINKKIIGALWLIFSLAYLVQGLYDIYNYSIPGILWVDIIPITIAYTKILCGLICLIIGCYVLKNNKQIAFFIFTFSILLLFYLVHDLIIYRSDALFYSGEHILLLILSLFTFRFTKKDIEFISVVNQIKENKFTVLAILILGFIPYILGELTTYDSFSFLH